MGYIITVAAFVLLAGLTVFLMTGHGTNLIAGFNTLSKNEKNEYDKPALCRFVGKILIPIEIAVFIGVFSGMAGASWSTLYTIIVSIACLPYIVVVAVYANTGNKFKKNA